MSSFIVISVCSFVVIILLFMLFDSILNLIDIFKYYKNKYKKKNSKKKEKEK